MVPCCRGDRLCNSAQKSGDLINQRANAPKQHSTSLYVQIFCKRMANVTCCPCYICTTRTKSLQLTSFVPALHSQGRVASLWGKSYGCLPRCQQLAGRAADAKARGSDPCRYLQMKSRRGTERKSKLVLGISPEWEPAEEETKLEIIFPLYQKARFSSPNYLKISPKVVAPPLLPPAELVTVLTSSRVKTDLPHQALRMILQPPSKAEAQPSSCPPARVRPLGMGSVLCCLAPL